MYIKNCFLVGFIYEDVFMLFLLLVRVRVVSYIEYELYGYRKRFNLIIIGLVEK